MPEQEAVQKTQEQKKRKPAQRKYLKFNETAQEKPTEEAARPTQSPKSTVGPDYIDKQKFAGHNFSVRQIPSPIFGFGKRDEDTLQKYREDVLNEFLELEGHVDSEETEEMTQKQYEEELSKAATDPDHQKNVFEQNEREESNGSAEGEKESAAATEPAIPAFVQSVLESDTYQEENSEEMNEHPEADGESNNEKIFEDDQTADEDDVSVHTSEPRTLNHESPNEVLTSETVLTDEPVETVNKPEAPYTGSEEAAEHKYYEEEKVTSPANDSANAAYTEGTEEDSVPGEEKAEPVIEDSRHEVQRKEKNHPSPALQDQQKRTGQESHEKQEKKNDKTPPRPAGNSSTSAVPYNVLMFQRDRVKQERRDKQNRGKGVLPELHLLEVPPGRTQEDDEALAEQSALLDQTLSYFNVKAKVVNVTRGPSVTRFEIQPEPGVKVSKITNLQDDIKLSLAARDIRMEAPIPGKNTIGIEVPNRKSDPVFLREILKSRAYIQSESPLTAGLGVDISGQPVVTDLQKMPHGLIAGATGSGKSVCMNAILLSLLYKASPEEVRLLLIDPKMVELAPYNGLPHLAAPVITDAKEATLALKWAVEEMERRYERFAETGARDLTRYNKKMREQGKEDQVFPYLIVVVDELADLMMVSPQEVEDAICRIAQKARACGIHLLVATQRPSVDVITGLIKANIPTRIAFSVSAQTDSRTILDTSGAERLLGRGDMLFLGNGESKAVRLQGAFVSDDEIERVTEHVKKSGPPRFLFEKEELSARETEEADDPLFEEVCRFIVDQGAASTSLIQRRFRMGFNRAARMIDLLEDRGVISPAKGSKPRDVYLTKDELEESFAEKG
ncbi:hypothetical protein CR205_00755 [Alteribacter lacisalsi]|uniref:FtsK domain-containing protein n=2 Tax=Alteribacter lacisalsi TaxID=2045244 RepID=A0A2W0HPS5_9BACI|nr:hypothetical protein CR205_00755 [Alteribacter lacisalsi]